MEQTQTRSEAVNLRVRSAQKNLIDMAAQVLGKSRSDFMLEAACDRARDVLLEQTFFTLDEKDYARFLELLDAPLPDDNRVALRRLMQRKAPWEKA